MFFQRIREHFAHMGISGIDLMENGNQLNRKIKIGLCMLGINVILQSLALIIYTHGFRGYTESIYMISFATASFLALFILVLKSKQLFELIDAVETLIAESKGKCVI